MHGKCIRNYMHVRTWVKLPLCRSSVSKRFLYEPVRINVCSISSPIHPFSDTYMLERATNDRPYILVF